jgi:hypothetical protein
VPDAPPASTLPDTETPPTAPATTDNTPPKYAVPTDFHAVAGDGTATFVWTPATGPLFSPAVSYTIIAYEPRDVNCRAEASAASSCTIDGLENGRKYRFFISITTADGSGIGGPLIFVTPSETNPSWAPGTLLNGPVLTGVAGDGTATITWAASTSDGGWPITQYTLFDYNGNEFTPCTVVPPEPLSCTLTGLQNGTTYNFTVLVYNELGDQSAGAAVSVTPAPAG